MAILQNMPHGVYIWNGMDWHILTNGERGVRNCTSYPWFVTSSIVRTSRWSSLDAVTGLDRWTPQVRSKVLWQRDTDGGLCMGSWLATLQKPWDSVNAEEQCSDLALKKRNHSRETFARIRIAASVTFANCFWLAREYNFPHYYF